MAMLTPIDIFVCNVLAIGLSNATDIFLDRCVERDLHLNSDKIQINIPSVPFFGQTLTK